MIQLLLEKKEWKKYTEENCNEMICIKISLRKGLILNQNRCVSSSNKANRVVKKTQMLAFLNKIKHQIQFSISIYLMNESLVKS